MAVLQTRRVDHHSAFFNAVNAGDADKAAAALVDYTQDFSRSTGGQTGLEKSLEICFDEVVGFMKRALQQQECLAEAWLKLDDVSGKAKMISSKKLDIKPQLSLVA